MQKVGDSRSEKMRVGVNWTARGLWGLGVLWIVSTAGCASQTPRPSHHPLNLSTRVPSAERRCRNPDGKLLSEQATVAEAMRESVNPLLTRVSFLMFHDPRPGD